MFRLGFALRGLAAGVPATMSLTKPRVNCMDEDMAQKRSRETNLQDEAPRDVQVFGVAPGRVREYEHQANSGSCEGISQ